MAMGDLHRGAYTGQYGFVIVESGRDPGAFDQEVFLALRDWEHFYTDQFVTWTTRMRPTAAGETGEARYPPQRPRGRQSAVLDQR